MGVVSSASIVVAASGMPLSSSAVAGAGTVARPWAIVIVPVPVGTGELHHAVHAQQVPGDGRADDVGNRIDRTHLVEVHLLHARAMHAGLRFRQTREDLLGQLALPWRKLPAVDHPGDVAQMPMGMLGRVFDDHLRGPEAMLVDLLHDQLAIGQTQGADARADPLGVYPGVDQRPQRHIAADAAGTIQIGNLHVRSLVG